jgi:long-chain acyl-CoA synthetase
MRPIDADATWDFNTETTLIRVLAGNARQIPDRIAMREKDRGIWQETTWAQMYETVLCCAAGLQSLGLQAGEGLLILGDNRPNLYMGMLAASALGAYPMPVFPDATPDELMHVVGKVRVRHVLAADQEQVDKALDLRERGMRPAKPSVIEAERRGRWCTRVHLALSGHVYAKRRWRQVWVAAS